MYKNIAETFKLDKRLCKAALLWGTFLLVCFVLLRGQPTEDIYHFLVNVSDFVTSAVLFVEAALDMVGYVLLLLLLATLAYALSSVMHAWGNRRRKHNNYC